MYTENTMSLIVVKVKVKVFSGNHILSNVLVVVVHQTSLQYMDCTVLAWVKNNF